MKEQHPDMPINIDRQSRVTFGGSEKNNFAIATGSFNKLLKEKT